MAAIYHPGVVATIPKYDLGQPNNAANVLYWTTAAVVLTTAQLTAVQTAFDTAWKALWQTWAGSGNRYMGSWVIDMSSNTGNQVTNVSYAPASGTGGANAAGDALCVLLSLKTLTRYRGGHGRIYLPGIATASVNADGHTCTGSTLSTVNTQWANVVNAMAAISGAAGGPYQPIVWHKKLSTAPNTTEPVVQGICQSVLATQRRRQRKVTRHRRD